MSFYVVQVVLPVMAYALGAHGFSLRQNMELPLSQIRKLEYNMYGLPITKDYRTVIKDGKAVKIHQRYLISMRPMRRLTAVTGCVQTK